MTAEDALGSPVTSYSGTVHFASSDTSSGVVLPADSTLTNGQGTFSLTLTKAGSQTVTVSDAANALTTTATMGVTAAAANSLALATAASPKAGTPFQFTVTAKDSFGNTDTSYAGTVHFTSSDSASGVSLPADGSLTNGQQTFSATLVTLGSQTITATGATITGTLSVTVSPGNASKLVLATSGTPTAGTAFQFTVTAQDPFGNTATSYTGTVHFTSSDTSSGVVLPADSTLTNGQRTFSATLIRAGAQTITATDKVTSSITGNLNVSVRPGAAAVVIVAAPATVVAGQSFNFTVTLKDGFGNAATGYTGTMHFTTNDISPLVVLPADYAFNGGDAGAHTFSATLWTPPSRPITATDTVNASLTGTAAVGVTLVPPLP